LCHGEDFAGKKGCKVPKTNRLKTLIREKQAEYKKQHGKHLPQHIIAAELGVDPATLSEYMNNKIASVNWDIWQRIANYFGIPGYEIFNVMPDDEV
jgi:transcriptional regulator with XRE-family HTH domain